MVFWHENHTPSSHFGTHPGSKIMRKSNLRVRSALGPYKNKLWLGGWRKHDNLMKIRCENHSSLIVQNAVWQFSKDSYKSMPKGTPKVLLSDPKVELGSARVDWFCHLGWFWRLEKTLFFRCRFEASTNRYKSSFGRPGWQLLESAPTKVGQQVGGRRGGLSKIYDPWSKIWSKRDLTRWPDGSADISARSYQ